MKIILLGTGGFIPTDKAQTACFMLPEVGILLDAGTGLFRMSQYLQTDTLDIYLTHAHGDHFRGLNFLFAAFFVNEIERFGKGLDDANLQPVLAKANERWHASRIHAAPPALDALAREYNQDQMVWQVLNAREPLPQGGTLTSFNAENHGEVGFRLDWPGHSLAYITDTIAKPDVGYIEYIQGVDLLLHECNGPDRLADMMANIHHSHTSAVAQVAAQARVGRCILVHKNPIEAWDIKADLEPARCGPYKMIM
jgi:ribonuclease Z